MKNLMGMMDMVKQVKELQEKMADMQTAVEAVTETGSSGAGLVRVTLNGKGMLNAVNIDPSLFKDTEKQVLEDLLVAAYADAKAKIETIVQSKMQELTGGLQLPPGMKLPF